MDLIHRTFAQEGPFDGVFGFSQGASTALAYLLEQQHASKQLPVKLGVFASPPPILATDSAYIQGMYGGLSPEDLRRLRSADREEISQLPEPIRTAGLLLFDNLAIMSSVHGKPLSYFFDREVSDIPCVLLPDVFPLRLNIPTLHVCSRDDPPSMQGASEAAAGFCEHRSKKVFRHGAVHNLPRDAGEAREMARLMREIIEGSSGVSRL
ncbi:hypothetical protein BJY01DRAFT_244880 [Aspergillus pseudoustus]|uniref:Serine hydrolase domain-containing protein n=1 Tax=Aspergillus pseudoustus TaxID=1810923 RepID=A0ABR4KGZ1_9EURO